MVHEEGRRILHPMIYLGHKSLRIRYYPKYSLMRGERVPPCDFSTSSSSHPQLVPASPYSPCLSQTPAKPTRAGSSLGNSPLSHPSRLSSCPLPECFRFSSWSLTTTQPACKTPGETTTQSSGSTNQPVCRTRAQPPSHTYQVGISSSAHAAPSAPVQSQLWILCTGFFLLEILLFTY